MSCSATGIALLVAAATASAEIKVVIEHNSGASAGFKFKSVPPPSRNDAATKAKLTLVDGERDGNGGELTVLQDGRLPRDEDRPADNFFFTQNTDGGRLQIDLGSAISIQQINTYSWHAGDRGPQVYKVYASDGQAADFEAKPRRTTQLPAAGWKLVATVDTRGAEDARAGSYGVSIADPSGPIGPYRYLLFDVFRTETRDPFGNTFFSEIDVVDPITPALAATDTNQDAKPITASFTAEAGKYHFTIDSTVAPDLTDWANEKLRPVVQEWYPKLIALLPSDGFSPRTNVTIRFRDNMNVPASAGGGFINCNASWFRRELKREALGSVVHEMVHVVQNYQRARRDDPSAARMPGWLVEGIPDYIRWFLYEPQTKGAEVTKGNLSRAKYDASYRITGNFLNWVSTKYDTNIVVKLNAAGRAGRYGDAVWKDNTGKTVEALGAEWLKAHEDRLGATVEKPAK